MTEIEDEDENCMKMKSVKRKKLIEVPNGGYGWVIVISSFMCCFVTQGSSGALGILLPSLLDLYETRTSEVSWAIALHQGFQSLIGPFCGLLTKTFSFRKIVIAGSLLYSVMFLSSIFAGTVASLKVAYTFAGIGAGLVHMPAVMIVPQYFTTKRGLAIGLTMCGSSCGCFLMPLLTHYLLHHYGYQGTIIIMSGCMLQCVVFGALLRPLTNPSDLHKNKGNCFLNILCKNRTKKKSVFVDCGKTDNLDPPIESLELTTNHFKYEEQRESFELVSIFRIFFQKLLEIFPFQLIKENYIWLLYLANVVGTMGYFISYIYLFHNCVKKGINEDECTASLVASAATNLIGRIFTGLIADKFKLNPLNLLNFTFFVFSLSLLTYPFCTISTLYITITSVSGFFSAGFIALVPLILVDIMGLDKATQSYGILGLFRGLALVFGIPIGGYVYDFTHNYDIVYYTAGSLAAISVIFTIFLSRLNK